MPAEKGCLPMTYLNEHVQNEIREKLANVRQDVELIVYTHADTGHIGDDRVALDLLSELAELHPHVHVTRRILAGDTLAETLGITVAPTVLFRERGSNRTNLRFMGIPSGYEFSTVLETINMLGGATPVEPSEAINRINEVTSGVRLRTFVTPTCPHCPRAVLTTFTFAVANEHVVAEVVDSAAFPALASSYFVSSVPDTVIEGFALDAAPPQRVRGAQAPHAFAQAVMEVVNPDEARALW